MKVKRIYVKNFKAISELEADFNGCTAIITAGNNKGKTTFLRSLVDRIRNGKNNKIIKEGEKEGCYEYELTDGSKFIWSIKGESESLAYITKEGIEINKGIIKSLGDKYFGQGFDIDEFLNSQPKKQKQILFAILGIDIEELDLAYNEAYNTRREMGVIFKTEEAKLKTDIKKVEYIDVDKIRAEINEIQRNNEKIEYIKKGILEKQERLEKLNQEIKSLEKEIKSGDIWIEKNKEKDTTLLQVELYKGEQNNKEYQKYQDYIRQVEVATKAREQWQIWDDKVKDIDNKRFDIIKNAQIPEGFQITEEGVKYNGFDLDKSQLSSSSIYIASLKLATMGLGEIKTVCFDASYLDKKSLDEVEKWADTQGLQLLIERPDFDGGEIKYEIIS